MTKSCTGTSVIFSVQTKRLIRKLNAIKRLIIKRYQPFNFPPSQESKIRRFKIKRSQPFNFASSQKFKIRKLRKLNACIILIEYALIL